MIYRMPPLEDDWLTEGVLARRAVAWFLDALLIAAILVALGFALLLFGLLTLGLGLPLLGVLPFVPFCYHLFSLAGPMSATPGQTALGLIVRRNDDFGRPTPLQAVISTLLFYLTLSTAGILLVVALFTIRRRTLHDLLSGLVVVRAQRLQTGTLTGGPRSWNMQGGSPYA
jgi:uncharacterized RDD family membrane protein YckC